MKKKLVADKKRRLEDIDFDWVEFITAVNTTQEDDEEGGWKTAIEIAEACKRSVDWVRRRLKRAKQQGVLLRRRVFRESIDGRSSSVPAYKIKVTPPS